MTKTINEMEELIKAVESLGWHVEKLDSQEYQFSKLSPAGQDFNFIAYRDEIHGTFVEGIYEAYKDFDVSYETYLWLDESGHGKNGAPYDMRDLYNDMNTCKEMILDLYEFLSN